MGIKDKIVTDPEILRQPSEPVTMDYVREHNLRYRLLAALETAWTKGSGLAAIQIGIPKRYAIIRLRVRGGSQRIELCNPRLVGFEGPTVVWEEGCLSIPKQWFKVPRYHTIKIVTNPERSLRVDTFTGHAAQAIQHELDHFGGKLVSDHATVKPDLSSTICRRVGV